MAYKRKICGIYVVTHIKSGRQYVGKSVHIRNRWAQHLQDCRKYNNRFCNALAKYGKAAFAWEIVEECPEELLNEREKAWISKLGTMLAGFNLTPGGDGVAGLKHSAEERAAKSARQRGKPHSPEHNKRVSDALRNRKRSPEEVARLRAMGMARRGIKVIYSDEALEKMRAASARRRGTKQRPESHAKQWQTRRSKYGQHGFTPAGLATVSARAKTLVLSRWQP